MMPDRVIRDELLTSKHYWAVSIEAQQLFVHLLLSADDLARYTGCNFAIRAKCYPGRGMEPDKLEHLLQSLSDADLIRLYYVGNNRFIFIPKFRQRLRYYKSKYPPPPIGISDIPLEKSDLSRSEDSPKSAEEKRSEEKRSFIREDNKGKGGPGGKQKNCKKLGASAPFCLPEWIPQKHWDAWVEARTKARKPPTLYAKKLAVMKLEHLKEDGYEPAQVLMQSAFNNWGGLFPLKA